MEKVTLNFTPGVVAASSTTDRIVSVESGVAKLCFGPLGSGVFMTFRAGEKIIIPAGIALNGYASEEQKNAVIVIGPFGV